MLLFNNVCIVNAMVIVFVDVKNFDVKNPVYPAFI